MTMPLSVEFIDQHRSVVATAQVMAKKDYFGGEIDLRAMPAAMRQKFDEFEEMVNDQIFSLLDEIEEQIAALPIRVIFQGGPAMEIKDLQIYPTTNRVSFKILNPAEARETLSHDGVTRS